ncbi:MAG: hypothetical protein JWR69_4075 [Pedosphaera sp.]|nr:hypothetical protein [Pedosphaera sp.]
MCRPNQPRGEGAGGELTPYSHSVEKEHTHQRNGWMLRHPYQTVRSVGQKWVVTFPYINQCRLEAGVKGMKPAA